MERHSPCSYRAHGLRETDINVYICEFLIAVITNQQKTEAWGKKKNSLFLTILQCRSPAGSAAFSAPGFSRPNSRYRPSGLLLGDFGKNLLPSSLSLLVESSCLWLLDLGPFLCWLSTGGPLNFSEGLSPVLAHRYLHLRASKVMPGPSHSWNL